MTDIAHSFVTRSMLAFLLFIISSYEHVIKEPFPLIPTEMALQFLQWFDDKRLLDRPNLTPVFDGKSTPFSLISKNIKSVSKFLA